MDNPESLKTYYINSFFLNTDDTLIFSKFKTTVKAQYRMADPDKLKTNIVAAFSMKSTTVRITRNQNPNAILNYLIK